MDIDLTKLPDEELDALRVKILTEQERRANLAQIPATIQELATKYTEGGGDPTALEQAIKAAE